MEVNRIRLNVKRMHSHTDTLWSVFGKGLSRRVCSCVSMETIT